MARTNKEKEKEKEKVVEKPKEDSTAVVTVNIDDFTRTRDSVIVSLATLQSAVSDLSRAYINHANTILNRGPATLDLGSVTTSLLENGILGNAQAAVAAGVVPDDSGEKKTKKKQKRVHDPNAPKRALTPYFLYMQTSRPLIAKELGPTAKPKEIADEGARRWKTMPAAEKQSWQDTYQDNLAVYRGKLEAYKAGLPIPGDDGHEAAQQLQQGIDNATESSPEPEQEQEQEQEPEESSESSSESEEESSPEPEPEPVKEPTPPRQKRRRTLEAKNAAESTPVKKGSPEKKRKTKAADDRVEKIKKAAATDTPKSEKKRKKRKSEMHDD